MLFIKSHLHVVPDEKSRKEDILKLAEGHILQKAELRGKYQRKHQ